MPFDLSVTISMHFYERCQTKNVRFEKVDSSSQVRLFPPPPPGGEWGVLLYFHAYVGTGYFRGFKILNFNIFGGFQKTEYFWGYEDFVDIIWGHHKIGLYDTF